MKVVFLSPAYPVEMQEYVRGLSEVGAQVYGIGDGGIPADLKPYLSGYLKVDRLFDEQSLVAKGAAYAAQIGADRVESLWEPLTLPAAKIRKALGMPGMSPDTVIGFRDKSIMKARVAAAGLRVPKSRRCTTVTQIREGVEAIGYPIILKPIAGAGSADTYRVNNAAELEKTLPRLQHVAEVSCEEFIDGREFTYDTVCVRGTPRYENVAEYLPRPLIARSNEWISPVIITVANLNQAHIKPGIALGRGVLKALGMGTGFTHMEWYLTDRGEIVFGEIGCRPGGAHLVDQMNFTSDIDLFREWARAVCWEDVRIERPRRYNTAIIFKRAMGQGHIKAITGLKRYMAKYGQAVVAEKLLRPGQRRRDWNQTLVSDGFIIARHPDWNVARELANRAAVDIQLIAG